MLTIDGIPSVVSNPSRGQGEGAGQPGAERNTGLAVDTYSGESEPWRNTAKTSVGDSGTTCRCGNCPACVAKAYSSSGEQLSSAPPVQTDKGSGVEEEGRAKKDEKPATTSDPRGEHGEALSQQEKTEVAELKKIDRAVRAHEQAHMSAAGSLVQKGVSLRYEKGPDGRRYAVAGEVSIDTSKEADPADTITKMQTVRAAALAPADPSPQDRKVAAAATAAMTKARSELRLEKLAAEENAKDVIGRAADKLAAGKSDEVKLQNTVPGESTDKSTVDSSPRQSHIVQRYFSGGAAQVNKLTFTA